MESFSWTEEDVLRCCGSKCFAKELTSASPFSDLHHAIQSACEIWFNKAFAAHPPIESISPSVLQSLFFQSLSFLFLFWNPFNFLLLPGLGGPRKNNLLQWLLPLIPHCRNWWTGISVIRRSLDLCSSYAPLEGARWRSLLN
ncbi:hypothetical protein ZIOFF_068081 [Zingiber officinale]|uniref:Uncharacterized protein n=1 Tax=Zingiber officinale TaxID=94328 RepID=A0A8J5C7Q9_ZINOF|nr:hypothetical protein ZIOFF_068081 [Zingiber officinale]